MERNKKSFLHQHFNLLISAVKPRQAGYRVLLPQLCETSKDRWLVRDLNRTLSRREILSRDKSKKQKNCASYLIPSVMTPRIIGAILVSKNYYPIENSNFFKSSKDRAREKFLAFTRPVFNPAVSLCIINFAESPLRSGFRPCPYFPPRSIIRRPAKTMTIASAGPRSGIRAAMN